MLRNALVWLSDSPETEFAVDAALAFTKGYGAALTGCYVRQPMTAPRERQAATLQAFEAAAERCGERARCEVRSGDVTEELAALGRTADLVVMGRGENGNAKVGADVESLVRAIPHPFLLASEKIEGIRRVMVAYDGSPGAVRALAMAADIAHHWSGDRPELLVVEVAPADGNGSGVLASAQAYLDLYGLPCRTIVAHGRAGEALPKVAADEEVDLLCMGAFSHWRLRDFVLGSTTLAVLEGRRKPVLLCH